MFEPYDVRPELEHFLNFINLLIVTGEKKALADIPNALGYQRILETSTNGYLVRQYIYNSLYDRMRYT